MRKDLMFDHDNEEEVWQVVGATTAVFLLVHYGYLTFKQAEACFHQPEHMWKRMYKEWLKYNNPDEAAQECEIIPMCAEKNNKTKNIKRSSTKQNSTKQNSTKRNSTKQSSAKNKTTKKCENDVK